MKTILKNIIILLTATLLVGCSVSIEDTPIYETDNEYTNWSYHSSSGYSGGDVGFAGLRVMGEWSAKRIVNYSGKIPSFDISTSLLFDDIRWYRYVFDPIYGRDLIYEYGYGISRDGLTLSFDDYCSYRVESVVFNDNHYGYCINAVESSTDDIYQFCKVD